jgi:hypothetical protein
MESEAETSVTNKAGWAHVAGMVREFDIDGYPVIMGLTRLLAWAQGVFGGDAGRNCRGVKRELISVATAGRNPKSAGKSKGSGATASTPRRTATSVAPALLDTLRARARAPRRYTSEDRRRG